MFRFAILAFLGTLAAAENPHPLSDIKITIARKGSGMDMSLPVYKLTLEGDGSVLFEGKHRVSAMGLHRKHIRSASVRDLAEQFAAIGYFDFGNHLGSCEDAAIVVTSVTMGSKRNEVFDWGCRTKPELDKLEDEVDRVGNSKIWIRGRIRVWLHWPWFHS